MAGKIKGITIEIGGNTQPLNKALEGVNKKSRDLQSELRHVDRLLKLDPKNTELVAQKQKLLAESVETTKDKLETLKRAEKQVQQQFKEGKVGEEQYRLIQREVVATEQSLKGLESQLKEVNNKWKNAADGLDKFGQKAQDVGKNMTMKVTAPIVAAGAVSFKMAADVEDAMGATDQIYKRSADMVKKWADGLEGYYGIAKGEALEYANMMGSMLQNIGGLTEEEAAKQAATLIELAGDLSAMYGGSTADAVQALTGALKGNNAMLDNYGMAVNDALIKSKAFEMGIYSGKGEMDLATKQAATLALVMEQSSAAQGQAAREADGASGSMKSLQKEIKDLSASLGEELLPIITPIIKKIGDIIAKFSELSPTTKKMIVIIALIAAAIGPLLVVFGMMASGIASIIGLVAVVGPVIGAVAVPIGIAVAAIAAAIAIGVLLYKNWDTVKEHARTFVEGIKALFGAFAGPIVSAVEAVIKIGKTLYENWDKITAKAKEVVATVKEKFDEFRKMKIKLPEIKFPKIKLPHFTVKGKLSLNPPSVPSLGVNWYKTGGIFNGPSVIGVGEAGTEVVAPIDKLKEYLSDTTMKHTGTIRVEGVSNSGELVAAGNLILDNMKFELARGQRRNKR